MREYSKEHICLRFALATGAPKGVPVASAAKTSRLLKPQKGRKERKPMDPEDTVRTVARGAYTALMSDEPLSSAARVDLAVTSDDHWRALQVAVRHGATAEDLDAAIGQFGGMGRVGHVSQRLAGLIAKWAPSWTHLVWTSTWDEIRLDEDDPDNIDDLGD